MEASVTVMPARLATELTHQAASERPSEIGINTQAPYTQAPFDSMKKCPMDCCLSMYVIIYVVW
jgi:hypothetical protein